MCEEMTQHEDAKMETECWWDAESKWKLLFSVITVCWTLEARATLAVVVDLATNAGGAGGYATSTNDINKDYKDGWMDGWSKQQFCHYLLQLWRQRTHSKAEQQ